MPAFRKRFVPRSRLKDTNRAVHIYIKKQRRYHWLLEMSLTRHTSRWILTARMSERLGLRGLYLPAYIPNAQNSLLEGVHTVGLQQLLRLGVPKP